MKRKADVVEDNPAATCFVGGLPYVTDSDALKEFFTQYGEVASAKVIFDNATKKSKGFGFVTFASETTAATVKQLKRVDIGGKSCDIGEPQRTDKAAKLMTQMGANPSMYGSMGMDVGTRRLQAQQAPPERRVFVGGLPRQADEAALAWFFSQFGVVQDFTIINDVKTGNSKGYGFCTYVEPTCAAMVKSFGALEYMGRMMNVGEAMRGAKGVVKPPYTMPQQLPGSHMMMMGGSMPPPGMGGMPPPHMPGVLPAPAMDPMAMYGFSGMGMAGAYGMSPMGYDPMAAMQPPLMGQPPMAMPMGPAAAPAIPMAPPAGGPPALQMKTSFNVPETSVGAIIGKAGMFLKNICRLSGAQVNVSKDTSEAPAGERKIDIIGTAEQVTMAQQMVQQQMTQQQQTANATPGVTGTQDPVKSCFIGGLPPQVTEATLMTFFSSCGQIESVKVIYDPITGNSKGFGFITFVDAAVATALRAQGKVDMYGKQVDIGTTGKK